MNHSGLMQPLDFLPAQRDQVEPLRQHRVGDEEVDLHVASPVAVGLRIARKLEEVAVLFVHNGPAGGAAGNELNQRGRVAPLRLEAFALHGPRQVM
ncbi:hypothetical protein Trco_003678 [Trichoderma cornu-damae]|uniref:Uncharacterized protein n=1 Tax=Trichoderma cornu-damae TaxID=654480 RepID=A0A9P8QPR4_9HYPO|nr:hypothetical protein Trco_003678 [Trichoderma cornu-damae]